MFASDPTKAKLPQVSYLDLEHILKRYIHEPASLALIKKAYLFADKHHAGQKRASQDPYIIHPLYTAYFLALWKQGPDVVAAGLLHDVLEDTPVSKNELAFHFNPEIAYLVAHVTKVSYFNQRNRTEIKATYLLNLYLGMAEDIRIIFIKLADRLHNMKTLHFLPQAKQKVIAQETHDVYCPIAHRLGMQRVRNELSDLCLFYLDPKAYTAIINKLKFNAKIGQQIVEQCVARIKTIIADKTKDQFLVKVYGRYKNPASIHLKMKRKGIKFENIRDILAFRVITDSIDHCYLILGYLHQALIPIRNKFKDYIVTPKPNMYQSLHTSVVWASGLVSEIQIRTCEMERVAEEGIAAHWRYKEQPIKEFGRNQKKIDECLEMFRTVFKITDMTTEDAVKIAQQAKNNPQAQEEIIKLIQNNVFRSTIYVLTPQKKIIVLPYGSSVLDFAFYVHTDIGLHAVSAKVNGIRQSLNAILKSGDIVKISTNPHVHPHKKWLLYAKTNRAQNKIKRALQQQISSLLKNEDDQKLNHLIGQLEEEINHYLIKHNLKAKLVSCEEQHQRIVKHGFKTWHEVLKISITNKVKISELITKFLLPQQPLPIDEELRRFTPASSSQKVPEPTGVIIEGMPNIKVKLAQCCTPVPPEAIIGIIRTTDNSGIKIHNHGCANINHHQGVTASWAPNAAKHRSYVAKIKIIACDRPGLLRNISTVLHNMQVNLQGINACSHHKTNTIIMECAINIHTASKIKTVVTTLQQIPSIKQVTRKNR